MRVGVYSIRFKEKGGFIVPLIIIIVQALYLRESYHLFFRISMITIRFILFTSVIFFILTLREILEIRRVDEETETYVKKSIPEYIESAKRSLLYAKEWIGFAGLFFLAVYLSSILGFHISITLFLFFTMLLLKIKRYFLMFVFSLIFSFSLYYVFTQWLGIRLPQGILF